VGIPEALHTSRSGTAIVAAGIYFSLWHLLTTASDRALLLKVWQIIRGFWRAMHRRKVFDELAFGKMGIGERGRICGLDLMTFAQCCAGKKCLARVRERTFDEVLEQEETEKTQEA
jgi:hypothetical protein